MSFGGTLIAIIAILAFAVIRIAKYRAGIGDRSDHFMAPPQPARDAELEREVEALRERIAVLERIATDANTLGQRNTRAIADEIESLRDT